MKVKKLETNNEKEMKKIRKNPPFPILRANDENLGAANDDDDNNRNNPHFVHSNKMIPIIP